MALSIEEIKKLITSSIPDASIEIKGLMGHIPKYKNQNVYPPWSHAYLKKLTTEFPQWLM